MQIDGISQVTMKDGFISELGLKIIGAKEGIHYDGFESDHEDEDSSDRSSSTEPISENADNNRF